MLSASDGREQRLFEYLLGTLARVEQERLEEDLFADDELLDELSATTDDLIHLYLAGTLAEEEQHQFETHFLASRRHRERLEFVRDVVLATRRVAVAAPAPAEPRLRRYRWTLAAVAAAVPVTIAAALLFWRLEADWGRQRAVEMPPSSPTASGPAVTQPPLAEAMPKPPSTPLPDSPDESPRVFLLPSGDDRVTIPLNARTRAVRLEVPVVDDTFPSYDAVLLDQHGAEAWRAEGLLPVTPGGVLEVTIPAAALRAVEYVLSIRGETLRSASPSASLQSYRVHVVRVP